MEQKMRKNEFDFEMYLESMSQMKKMGGLIQYPWNDARSWNGNGGKGKMPEIDRKQLRRVWRALKQSFIP